MSESLDYLKLFAHFPFSLRRFLEHTVTLEESKQIVRDRMKVRGEGFLRIVERGIYGHPRSPYLPLLKSAGCELDDLRALVASEGVEGALRRLRSEGVYIGFEEFKGRKPIERPGLVYSVKPSDFDNPAARRELMVQSSGSTGLATNVGQDLDYLAAVAPHQAVANAAHGVFRVPTGSWNQIMPGTGLRSFLLWRRFGQMPEQWFSSIGWRDSRYWLKYALAMWYMLAWLRVYGARVPWPKIVRVHQARIVTQWMHDTLRSHGSCMLLASPSRAVRACLAAEEAGLDIAGAVVRGGGEPMTAAKIEAIRRVGARYLAGYAMSETGAIAHGCTQPTDIDDMHLMLDAFALITHPHRVQPMGLSVPAFNLTTLLDTAPKIMLNVQIDDYGIVEERRCGCELESYGFTTHLRQIRSYGKLVGEGATLIGNEMLHVLDVVLPARFGGSSLDYQLMEAEDERGLTRLYLVISPKIEIPDENLVVEALWNGLRDSSPMADAARTVWQSAESIRIKRMEPALTRTGKLLPLHIRRTRSDG